MSPEDLAARACTLPEHLKPAARATPRLGLLREVSVAASAGRVIPAADLREALRIAACVLLGGTAEEEGLARWLSAGQPANRPAGHEDAVALLAALISDGGGGPARVLGMPPDPESLPAQDVLEAAEVYPVTAVAAAMRRADTDQVLVGAADGTWAALFLLGTPEDVSSAVLRATEGRKTPESPPG